jgi:hypothetical protein
MAIEVSEGGPHRTLWANLQSVDRSMIVALCDALPFALSLLSAEPERAARAWKEWADLVKQLRSALARAV